MAGLARPVTTHRPTADAWIPGTRPGMTNARATNASDLLARSCSRQCRLRTCSESAARLIYRLLSAFKRVVPSLPFDRPWSTGRYERRFVKSMAGRRPRRRVGGRVQLFGSSAAPVVHSTDGIRRACARRPIEQAMPDRRPQPRGEEAVIWC